MLAASDGKGTSEIAQEVDLRIDRVGEWRMHWIGLQAIPLEELTVRDHGGASLSDDSDGVRTAKESSD